MSNATPTPDPIAVPRDFGPERDAWLASFDALAPKSANVATVYALALREEVRRLELFRAHAITKAVENAPLGCTLIKTAHLDALRADLAAANARAEAAEADFRREARSRTAAVERATTAEARAARLADALLVARAALRVWRKRLDADGETLRSSDSAACDRSLLLIDKLLADAPEPRVWLSREEAEVLARVHRGGACAARLAALPAPESAPGKHPQTAADLAPFEAALTVEDRTALDGLPPDLVQRIMAGTSEPDASALSFSALRAVNVPRCVTDFKHQLRDWSALEWAGAMAGEAGEAANVAKKILRLDGASASVNKPGDRNRSVLVEKLGGELADVVIYADLLAAREGIDLGSAVERTFNAKSREIGSAFMLPESAPGADAGRAQG